MDPDSLRPTFDGSERMNRIRREWDWFCNSGELLGERILRWLKGTDES